MNKYSKADWLLSYILYAKQTWYNQGLSKSLATRTRKSTQVNAGFRLAFNLRFVWPPTCVDNCVDFGRASSASRRQFFTVCPPNPSRHKLISSQLWIAWSLQLFATCEPTCESVWPPIASPYASSGFINLRRLASPFGQGLKTRRTVKMKDKVHEGLRQHLWANV